MPLPFSQEERMFQESTSNTNKFRKVNKLDAHLAVTGRLIS